MTTVRSAVGKQKSTAIKSALTVGAAALPRSMLFQVASPAHVRRQADKRINAVTATRPRP